MKKICVNKKAFFEYTIIEKILAGVQLIGCEVKSIRSNKVSIGEAYCFIKDGEIFIKNMHVAEHKESGKFNHESMRDRKLLLNKKEIIKLGEKTSQKGLTIIPLEIVLSDTGFIKILIGLAKGKNLFDKRESIKKADTKRELEKILKKY